MKINFDDWAVTPKHKKSDFAFPLSLEQKIDIFFERIDGWQLNIAGQLTYGVIDRIGKKIQPSQSAFAVLHIVLSFFEMIAKYQDGYIGKKSKSYFKRGVKTVFPKIVLHPKLLDILYSNVRCGLYHVGYTSPSVFVAGNIPAAIAFTKCQRIIINPQVLVNKLREYLKTYVQKLRDVNNLQLRKNFETRFDFDSSSA